MQAVLKNPFLDMPFMILIYILFLGIMVMMGAEIELKVIWIKLKRPVGIIIGLISQYLFMPAVLNHILLTCHYYLWSHKEGAREQWRVHVDNSINM